MTDERLNKHAAAEHLSKTVHVSPRTLDAWRREDRGPRSHKVEGRVFWFKSDLDQWLAASLLNSSRGGMR
jgi:predicted DNA-binding transcriptional regulator AlpA